MFSTKEKQFIADSIEKILKSLDHPEMPKEKLSFKIHIDGKEDWSWADIEPNWKWDQTPNKKRNLWNEPFVQDQLKDAGII